jgi:hypothetical protein
VETRRTAAVLAGKTAHPSQAQNPKNSPDFSGEFLVVQNLIQTESFIAAEKLRR